MRALFFTSRRRHTRWPRDWSADVCSSDLSADHIGKKTTDRKIFICKRRPESSCQNRRGGLPGHTIIRIVSTGHIATSIIPRSEEHTSELQSRGHLVCRLLLAKKKSSRLMISYSIKTQ